MQVADYTKVLPQSEAHNSFDLGEEIRKPEGPPAARPLGEKDG